MLDLRKFEIIYSRRKILSGDVKFKDGLLTGIIGKSGSGKSSLLSILSLYNYDKTFDYFIGDTNLRNCDDNILQSLMKEKISYLRQDTIFLDTMTCIENLEVECQIAGVKKSKEELKDILINLDLKNSINKYPKNLSGGEKQRLAIALAIAKESSIIICDEITSSLDMTNTMKIMNILSHLAHKNGKLIIISSHEEEVITFCDDVYEISNNEIHLIKESNIDAYEIKDHLDFKNNKKKTYIYSLANSRLKKKKWLFGLLVISISVSISLIGYAYIWLNQQQQITNNLLDDALTNELFINNNVTEHNFKAFNSSEFPLSQTFVEKISKINGVKSIYPFYSLSVIDMTFAPGIENYSLVEWFAGETKLGEFTYNTTTFDSEPYCIYPYFEEQNFSELVTGKIYEDNGIYLDKYTAYKLGIKEVVKDMKMRIQVFIPVAVADVTMRDGDNMPIAAKQYSHSIKTIIELPISGILPNSYTDSAAASSTTSIFIPYEYLMNLIKTATDSYELLDGEEPLQANAYKVFLESSKDRIDVKNKILNLSPTVIVFDSYEDYISAAKLNENQRTFLKISMMIVIVILGILLLVYGIYHKKEAYQDYYYYNIHGLSKKERQKITGMETIIISSFMFAFSLFLINIFVTNGLGGYTLSKSQVAPVSYVLIVSIVLLLSISSSLLCELPLFIMKD